MAIFFIQYEVIPLPENESYSCTGGAYANCFIRAGSEESAVELALASLQLSGWHIVNLEDGPRIEVREEWLQSEWLEAFDTAVGDGECYVLHTWPNEAQEKNELH